MILVYTKEGPLKGKEVEAGDRVHQGDLNGAVIGFDVPRHVGSSGRVYILKDGQEFSSSFFPSVIGAEWVDAEGEGDNVKECS